MLPRLQDSVIVLDQYTDADVAATWPGRTRKQRVGNLASRRVSDKAGLAPAGMFTADEGTLMVRYRTRLADPASDQADHDDPTSDPAERMR